MRVSGGVRVSAHVPDPSTNDQGVIIRKGALRDLVAPIWEGLDIVFDEVTKASTGEIVLTAYMLVPNQDNPSGRLPTAHRAGCLNGPVPGHRNQHAPVDISALLGVAAGTAVSKACQRYQPGPTPGLSGRRPCAAK